MGPKIRVGIVGATVTKGGSGWGAHAHVPALKALPDYELKAVCTAHADTAQQSAAAFGADLAFDRFGDMVAHPEIDLVVVSVRVPGHHDLVVQALQAGKAVFSEWPLGANLAEAEAMHSIASANALRTAVGLQAQSDPSLMYARDLVAQGEIGEVLSVSMTSVSQAVTQRGNGRIWQGDRKNGANTLTIAGGHAIDALCFVLGEFAEVTARLATRIPEWHNTDTGATMAVDSPDWVSVTGRLSGGAEVSFLTATVPFNPSGHRFEIYGSDGTLVIDGGATNGGPNHLHAARGREPLAPMDVPRQYHLVPDGVPSGPPRNVAQAYARLAAAVRADNAFEPDFAHAVKRHRLVDAIERSSAEGRTIRF
ncbi:MAG TPA: Gfo/Idh/MocA family oxidoreductase [Chloroflexota bacterium]|jgi:predicted dehydrogenase|nr:Gfo/Idh/MocA family oxidoreductase [Chloroflexota bacterium]